ncbi:Aspartyl protease APCB1 [Citrus sinensis]|uniref:Aspartyl protease APCB1 n=1 Tax=Citrus sinensis TaxID=2711 RepID=A0ACB8LZ30_CITSI|nr:Aspartyl protease APCB1 [Citrus sinensis]
MDSDESPSPPPQLTGVVIITLPPPNNPSLGKTITAYTLTDNSPQSQQTHHQQQQEHPLPAQLHPPQDSQFNFSLPMLFPVLPRKLFLFLAISIFALILYGSVFSYTLQHRYKSNNDDENKESFVFPLYHKFGIREVLQRDAEFKLGRFVDLDGESVVASVNDGIIRPHKSKINKKLVPSNAVAVDSSSTFPLRGNVYPDGLYFTYMIVGNPPRPYYLDMDTGSDLTWIQCDAPCSSCAKGANPLYKPRMGNILPYKDSLCMEIQRNHKPGYCETCQQCDYEIEYADHSSSMGVLARDELHLTIENGSLTKPNVVFGCAYDQQGLLLNTLVKTDGILGLSRAKVSLPSQLASQGIIKNVVGHCLTTNAGGGGYMFLGHDLVPSWGIAYVFTVIEQHLMEYDFLFVYSPPPGARNSRVGWALFDTGSSYTYFTKQAYSELIASLKEVSSNGLVLDASDPTLPVCWRAKFPIRSIVDVKQYFKTLTLHFGSKWQIVSTKFHISPEGYLVISKKGNICLGILDGSEVHNGSTIILGDISLRGQLVVYDNVNKRIGWAKSHCMNPGRFKSLPFLEG